MATAVNELAAAWNVFESTSIYRLALVDQFGYMYSQLQGCEAARAAGLPPLMLEMLVALESDEARGLIYQMFIAALEDLDVVRILCFSHERDADCSERSPKAFLNRVKRRASWAVASAGPTVVSVTPTSLNDGDSHAYIIPATGACRAYSQLKPQLTHALC